MSVVRVFCLCVLPLALASSQSLDFSPAELPWAIVDQFYAPPALSITGAGRCPEGNAYFSVEDELPPGLTLSATGQLEGIPQRMGTYRFGIRLANACSAIVKPIKVVVTGAPILLAMPQSLGFHYRQGGPRPEPQSILVTGTWPDLPYRVDARRTPWVRAVPRRGRLARPGAAAEADAVEVSISPEGLAPGTHEMYLSISAWMGVNAPTVRVQLVVD